MKMNEEEKKAIDILKDFTENEDTIYCYDWQGFDYETILSAIECLLNLIDKQQKEIEELKEINKQQFLNYEAKIDKMEYEMGYEYISKDKVKEMIEELEENIKNYNESSYYDPFYNTDYIARVNAQIIILKSLLKEGEPDVK